MIRIYPYRLMLEERRRSRSESENFTEINSLYVLVVSGGYLRLILSEKRDDIHPVAQ
jgi:hypothetical protein